MKVFNAALWLPKWLLCASQKCQFAVFFREVECFARIFVVIQSYPNHIVRILEQFNGQILEVFSLGFWDIRFPFTVQLEVIHSLKADIRSLKVNEIWLEWIETLRDFSNGVRIGSSLER